MEVFVVTAEDQTFGTQVHGVHWTRWHAERNIENLGQTHENVRVHSVRLDPLAWLVNHYFRFRGLTEPSAAEALFFVGSEVGELQDAYVHQKKAWVRNNPEAKGAKRVDFEAGDCLFMLTKFADTLGFDPLTAMIEKFQSKGWRQ